MLVAINRILRKDIIRVFSLTALSTLVKMLTGFASIKFISFLIGPAGIALLGQLNNFLSIFLTISTGGINNGVTKYVAEYSGTQKVLFLFLRSTFWIALTMSIFGGIVLLFGAEYFSNIILKDANYSFIIRVLGCTLIFYSFNSLLLSILNGFKEYKKYVIVNITSSLIGLVTSLLLSFYFGVYGALLSAVTFESIVFIVTLVIIGKSPWIKQKKFLGTFSVSAGRKLGQYSLMAFTSASTVPVGQLIIRSQIVKHNSLADAGLWEGMNRISGMYLFVIISSLGVYYLPRLSEIKTDKELKEEIFSTYKIVIPALLFMLVNIFLFKNLIVDILFNHEFQKMENLFLFQLTGDFFKISSWILSYQMIAKSLTKTFIITEICGVFTYVTLALFFVNFLGGQGATIAYAITNFIYFLTMGVIFRNILFKES